MKRGEVYWMDIKSNVEHINNCIRPVLIVSNDKCNKHSQVVHVVPLTTAYKKPLPTHVKAMIDGKLNAILCEHIMPVNSCDITESNRICSLPKSVMDKVSIAMMKQIGIMEV